MFKMADKVYDTIIIGSGAAGMSAAIYASRAMLDFIVIEKSGVSGGQMLNTSEIDNYPGFIGESGAELAMAMRTHALKLGAEIISKTVTSVKKCDDIWKLACEDGTEYSAKSIIAATGADYRRLGVPGEAELAGRGVSYCAVCDGRFFKNKTVAVVGGGDTAAEDALYLSEICDRVYLIHRRDKLRAKAYLAEQVQKKENIIPLWNSEIVDIQGYTKVDKIVLKDGRIIEADGVFAAIGEVPQNDLFKDSTKTDDSGFLIAGEDCATSAEGLFAAGDLRSKKLRQVVTAAADGANAVTSAEKYLERRKK